MGYFVMYYTYAHYSPQGELFYIGKGIGDRAYSFSDRSHDWKRAVKHHNGVRIEILTEWKTEQEAFDHEIVLIDCFTDMGYSLVNKTKGGKGAYGVVYSDAHKNNLSKKLRGFVHKKITCPHCNTTGGETSMKRWHFDKCTGIRPFKARTTVNGVRVYIGRYETKELADDAVRKYLEENK